MSDIKLNDGENALWNEVGSRGDMFRAAMRDRAAEESRTTGHMTEIQDGAGGMLDTVKPSDPVPERVYDDESLRPVANHPNLHRVEAPQHGELHEGDAVGYGDSGRVIAGEIHAQNEAGENPRPNGWVGAAQAVASAVGAAVGLAHMVGDRAKELVHKNEEKLHAPEHEVVRPESKLP